ncbi:MAG: AbrB/MazE/SpoVT family DNA-binding domain-containing protein [Candidatus Thermoplasmatota archaeon]
MEAEPEITTMGEKGQVVIPKSLRDQMGVLPRTRFVVFGSGDLIVLKKLALPDVRKEWEEILAAADRKGTPIAEEDVAVEVQAARKNRRKDTKGR